MKGKGPQKLSILLRNFGPDHNLINDKIVPLLGHCSDSVSHPPHCAFKNRTGLYGDNRPAAILRRLEHEAISMVKHLLRQHIQEGVHGDV